MNEIRSDPMQIFWRVGSVPVQFFLRSNPDSGQLHPDPQPCFPKHDDEDIYTADLQTECDFLNPDFVMYLKFFYPYPVSDFLNQPES